ncbi:MAG: hypothetical protein C4344_03770, partial [Acidimicrobiia bacterium]
PSGGRLPADLARRRHAGIAGLVLAHVPLCAAIAAVRHVPWSRAGPLLGVVALLGAAALTWPRAKLRPAVAA